MSVVKEFHEAFGQPAPDYPSIPSDALVRLRMRLIREEFQEVMEELASLTRAQGTEAKLGSLGLILKELADLRYVVEGTAVAFGLPIEEAYRRVHASNMSKLGEDGRPVLRPDGKAMKGPNYAPPDLSDLIVVVNGHSTLEE